MGLEPVLAVTYMDEVADAEHGEVQATMHKLTGMAGGLPGNGLASCFRFWATTNCSHDRGNNCLQFCDGPGI
jgi:hypothetical protein